jgi:hypothetical protein
MLRHNPSTNALGFVTWLVFQRFQSFVKEKVYLNDLVHASLDNSKHGDNALQYGDLIVQPSFIQNTSISDK